MKIEIKKESFVAAFITAVKNLANPHPSIYLDCNGKCYTDETRPEEKDCLTAEIWSYTQFWVWNDKLCKEVKMTREELATLPDDELEEIALEELQDIDLDNALKAILDRERHLYEMTTYQLFRDLPSELAYKVEAFFDSMRESGFFWYECREAGVSAPFWYDYSEVAELIKDYNLGIYHGKSITALFDNMANAMLHVAGMRSNSMYNAVLNELLEEWENKVRGTHIFGTYHIDKDCTIYLFTLRN